MALFTVRQYFPSFVEGFEPMVVTAVPEADLMNPDVLPWLKNFIHNDQPDYAFVEFYIDDPKYQDGQLIISARYNNGKHWVAALATPEKTAMAA